MAPTPGPARPGRVEPTPLAPRKRQLARSRTRSPARTPADQRTHHSGPGQPVRARPVTNDRDADRKARPTNWASGCSGTTPDKRVHPANLTCKETPRTLQGASRGHRWGAPALQARQRPPPRSLPSRANRGRLTTPPPQSSQPGTTPVPLALSRGKHTNTLPPPRPGPSRTLCP